MVMEDLGNTGLELTNVSAVSGGQYASMIYDQATGYLLVSSYQDGETAKLYAIDPAVLIPAEVGNFGEKVWPVVSLYQYNRATDLTLKVNPTDVTIYVGESKEISTKVILRRWRGHHDCHCYHRCCQCGRRACLQGHQRHRQGLCQC